MKLITLSFIGCLLFALHCASSQPLEFNNDLSGLENSLKGEHHSLHHTNLKDQHKRKQNPVKHQLPVGYTELSKHPHFTVGYKYHTNKVTWNEALKTCSWEGGFLAFPDSQKEGRTYYHILQKANNGGAWIGLHDMFEEGEWVTVLNEKVDDLKYVNWAITEPNNYGHNENCAEIYDKDGAWYDSACDKRLSFFCKIIVRY